LRVRTVALIAAGALAIRFIYLSQLAGDPLLSVLMGDARVYDEWAMRIAGGDWMGREIFYQTPLYPYLLGVLFRVAGHDLDLVRFIQAGLGAASCVLLALAGRRFFSERAGLIAAAILAVYPPAIFFDGLIQKSSLDLFLMTAILALLGEFQTRRDAKWLIAAGLVTGTLVLNRENAFVLFPAIGGWVLAGWRDISVATRLRWAGGFLAAAVVVLVPVALRNHRVGGEFVLSTAQLGPNFYIGNNAHASGSYESLVPGRGDAIYERADAADLASKAAGHPLTPGDVSRYWLRRAGDDISANPGRWLALCGKKLLLTVNAAEIPDTESIEAYAESSALLRGLSWIDFGIVLPLAAVGAWTHRREWRRHLVLYVMAAGLVLAVAAFFVVARYRYPIVPVVVLFAGAGIGSLAALRRSSREWIPAAVAALVVAAIAHVPMKVVHDQTYINLGAYLARNDRPGEALPLLEKAVSIDPGDYNARIYYGMVLCRFERTAECLTQFQEAQRLDPQSIDALLYTARAQAQGQDFRAALASLEKALTIATATHQSDRAQELSTMIRDTRAVVDGRDP